MKRIVLFIIIFCIVKSIFAQNMDLQITAKPGSETYTYNEGDELTIIITANKDCYFKVYHIDVNKEARLIYPNSLNSNNQIKANQQRVIPEAPMKYSIQAPFGQDTIIVTASEKQFLNIENEISNASRGGEAKGENLQIEKSGTSNTISTRFVFTSKPNTIFNETFSYSKPVNLSETVRSIKAAVQQKDGTFKGNNRDGTFTFDGVSGNYQVTGDLIVFNLRYTNQILELSRGVGFQFSIDKPKDINQAIQTVRTGIKEKGGKFEGDEKNGNFSASGITGLYDVADKIDITISQKPLVVPNSLIQKEVTNFFSGK